MRWRNVQMFGWSELRPPFFLITIGLLVIAIVIIAGFWFSLEEKMVVIPPEVKAVIQEVAESDSVQNNNVTNEVKEDDSEFYSVNTFFFSSECVFEYRRLMDDLDDLKSYRFNMDQAGNVAKVTQADEGLDVTRESLRRLITDCSR
ncbi:MAG: hypothetical protein Q7R96_05475 [Nanoarchaeota archaeon]|nr:hypothetical protein [Nanoarchaeota archaeon]